MRAIGGCWRQKSPGEASFALVAHDDAHGAGGAGDHAHGRLDAGRVDVYKRQGQLAPAAEGEGGVQALQQTAAQSSISQPGTEKVWPTPPPWASAAPRRKTPRNFCPSWPPECNHSAARICLCQALI